MSISDLLNNELLMSIISFLYWFLNVIFLFLTNPIIVALLIIYVLARFTKWYLKRQKDQKELEYLQKPSYEELEHRLIETEEELRALRRKVRQKAFKN